MTEQTEKPVNYAEINTELAKDRTHGSYESTMMAWIRTALTLIGFGIGIFEFTEKTGGKSIFRSSRLVGVLLIILGVCSMALAIRENRINHESLLNPHFKYNHKTSLGIKVGYALIVIGLISLMNVIIKIMEQ